MVLHLCISDLQKILGGELTLGMMPPLAGKLEPLRRVVVDSSAARPGDVYWAITGPGYDGAQMAEEAYARGALGVVVSSRHVEPWAGKFTLRVEDSNAALYMLAENERLRNLGRRLKPLPYHQGDTTGMVALLFRGDPVKIEQIIERLNQRRTRAMAV